MFVVFLPAAQVIDSQFEASDFNESVMSLSTFSCVFVCVSLCVTNNELILLVGNHTGQLCAEQAELAVTINSITPGLNRLMVRKDSQVKI